MIGTAAVGALLQNRLVSAMNSQATTRSAALPAQVRGPFVAEIQHSASNGIQVGAGQNGGSSALPGLPARLVAEIARIGHEVFTFGYVDAMRSTMLLPGHPAGRRRAQLPAAQGRAQDGRGRRARPARG